MTAAPRRELAAFDDAEIWRIQGLTHEFWEHDKRYWMASNRGVGKLEIWPGEDPTDDDLAVEIWKMREIGAPDEIVYGAVPPAGVKDMAAEPSLFTTLDTLCAALPLPECWRAEPRLPERNPAPCRYIVAPQTNASTYLILTNDHRGAGLFTVTDGVRLEPAVPPSGLNDRMRARLADWSARFEPLRADPSESLFAFASRGEAKGFVQDGREVFKALRDVLREEPFDKALYCDIRAFHKN